jgi:transcription elongation factor GreB
MRKGFTRKPQTDEPATLSKKYITPSGLQRLKDEHRWLLTRERPAVKWLTRKGLERGRRRRGHFGATVRYADAAGTGASGEHRGHRRGRSPPKPDQLGVASRARVDEVRSGRSPSAPSAERTAHLTVLEVFYQRIPVEPFREPAGNQEVGNGLEATAHKF